MRPARIIAAILLAAAVAATGSYLALSTADRPSATAQPPGATSPREPSPTDKPQPGPGPDRPRRDRPPTDRCHPSALQGSIQGGDGAAGTIWTTIQLRNASSRTCTVKGIPQVRLLGAQGQPVTAPSRPEGPAGSLVVLRPGQAARVAFHFPNACDTAVAGSRLQVTLPLQQGSVIVPLGTETRFGTCASIGVQAFKPSQALSNPDDPSPADRQALIYAAVLRQYLTSGDHSFGDHRFPQIFVLDHTEAGAGASGHSAPGGEPIPRAVQRAISHALTDVGPVTFVASRDAVIEPHGCAHVRDDGILVTLGPVGGSGDRVQVGVNGFVACLGANSLTYQVERTGRGWAVSGITARGPVA